MQQPQLTWKFQWFCHCTSSGSPWWGDWSLSSCSSGQRRSGWWPQGDRQWCLGLQMNRDGKKKLLIILGQNVSTPFYFITGPKVLTRNVSLSMCASSFFIWLLVLSLNSCLNRNNWFDSTKCHRAYHEHGSSIHTFTDEQRYKRR